MTVDVLLKMKVFVETKSVSLIPDNDGEYPRYVLPNYSVFT